MNTQAHFTIGQLAKAADIPSSTVRYYERRGLLSPLKRSKGNYRLFDQSALDQLLFIRSAQQAGFTLADITVLLDLRDDRSPPCCQVQTLIDSRLEQLAEQARHIRRVTKMLKDWKTACHDAQRLGQCAVLKGLGNHEQESCEKNAQPH